MFGRFTNSSEARKLIQDAHLCLMHLDKTNQPTAEENGNP